MAFIRPRLKAHLTTEVVNPSRAFVVSEERGVMLDGAAAVAILELLDGEHTVDAIMAQLSGRFGPADVFRTLGKLEALQLIAEGRPDLPAGELAYWDAVGVDAELVAKQLPSARATVVGVGNADVEHVVDALRVAGVATYVAEPRAADLADSSLVIAVVEDYLASALEPINAKLLSAGTPWVIIKPSGIRIWLGPLLRPGVTGCWACLRQRLHENRQLERYLLGRRNGAEPFLTSAANLPLTSATVAGLVLPDVVEILSTGTSPRLEGQLVTLDRRTLESTQHVLIRQPQCRECGDPKLISARVPRIVLAPREVSFSADGGYRTEAPGTTFARLSKHISPLLGAVSSVTPITESESGVTHAYAAGHNFALVGDNMELLRRNLRGQSGGKGRTDIQAKVSAVAEAIERYCGVWRGTEPVRRATYDELAGENRVHIGDILNYSDAQYDQREDLNRRRSGRFNLVPLRFRTDFTCDWTTTWSLTQDRPVLVPSGHVWFGHPDIERHFFAFGDGNGNAAGSVLEEAILQAICELVERDAVAVWWYNRLRRPGFDLDSLDDPYIETLRRYYRSLDREFWMLDITSDLGIPACAAVSRRLSGPAEDIVLGFGAHIDPYLAAMRAVTEMNQFLPAVTMVNPDGTTLYWEDDVATLDWWQNTRIANEPWLLPNDEPATTRSDRTGLVGDSLTQDVQGLLDRISAAGLEVLVADQSRPDIELSVVKVIVPGMRHFWRRLGPGRLYDVPVAMGWLDAPLSEDALNPNSVFF